MIIFSTVTKEFLCEEMETIKKVKYFKFLGFVYRKKTTYTATKIIKEDFQ